MSQLIRKFGSYLSVLLLALAFSHAGDPTLLDIEDAYAPYYGVDVLGDTIFALSYGVSDGNGYLWAMSLSDGSLQVEDFEAVDGARRVKAVGDRVYVLFSYYLGGIWRSGLNIYQFSGGALLPYDTTAQRWTGRARGLDVVGFRAYITTEDEHLMVIDCTDPEEAAVLGSYTSIGAGYDVQVVDNRAYVANGIDGLHIVNVANPAAMSKTGQWPDPKPPDPDAMRGVHVVGSTAYLVGEGFWAVNVANPATPALLGEVAHDALQVDVVGTNAYIAGNGGLSIFDVSNPSNLTFTGDNYATPNQAEDVRYVAPHIFLADRSGLLALEHGEAPPTFDVTITMYALENGAIENLTERNVDSAGQAMPIVPFPDTTILSNTSNVREVSEGLLADGITPLLFKIEGQGLTQPAEVAWEIAIDDGGTVLGGLDERVNVLQGGAWQSSVHVSNTVTLTPAEPAAFLYIDAIDISDLDFSAPASPPLSGADASTPQLRCHTAIRSEDTGILLGYVPFKMQGPPIILLYPGEATPWGAALVERLDNKRPSSLIILRSSADEALTWFRDFQHLDWAVTQTDCVAAGVTALGVRWLCLASPDKEMEDSGFKPYLNKENHKRGWFRRIVTVGAPHFGSLLYPYVKTLQRRVATIAADIVPTRTADLRLLYRLELMSAFSDSAFELEGLPFVDPDPNGKLRIANAVKHDEAARFHFVATTINPWRSDIMKYFGLRGGRYDRVFPRGSDGVVDVASMVLPSEEFKFGFLDAGHSILEGEIAHAGSVAPVYLGGTNSQTDSAVVAAWIADVLDDAGGRSGQFGAFQHLPDRLAREIDGHLDYVREQAIEAVGPIVVEALLIEKSLQKSGTGSAALAVESFEYRIDPPPGAPATGDPVWSAVVSTTGGVSSTGLTVTPDPGDPFAVTVEVDDAVVGDVILFVSYPTTNDQMTFGVPILVTRRDPSGVALAGIEVLPRETEVAPGKTVWPEFRAIYGDGSKQIRWAATDEVAVASSDAGVVDAPDLARWEALSTGCATVTVTYAGFTTQSIVTVTNPFPPRTFADWRDEQFSDEELTNSAISGLDVDLDGDGLDLIYEYLSAGHPRYADLWNHLEIVVRDIDGRTRPVLMGRFSKTISNAVVNVRQAGGILDTWQSVFRFDGPEPTTNEPPVLRVFDLGPVYEVWFDAAAVSSNAHTFFRQHAIVDTEPELPPPDPVNGTTELTFDLGGGALDPYGDRVAEASQGSYSYGGSGEYTPNVDLRYGDGAGTQTTGYGDLQNVAYAGNGIFEVRLFADPGCEVVLEGFDMAARTAQFTSDPTIDGIAVLDADGTALYSRDNVIVSRTAHTSFNLHLLRIEGPMLILRFDASNLPADKRDDIGIDNIRFSQRRLVNLGSFTWLTFDIDGLPSGGNVPQDYGDNVNGPTNGTYSYGGSGLYTPLVTTDYGPGTADLEVRNEGYGGLRNVVQDDDEHGIIEVTLDADDYYRVKLFGFDLAARGSTFPSNPVLNSVSVLDYWGDAVFVASNVLIHREYREQFDFAAAPVMGRALTVRIDASNLGADSDAIGLDNIRFGQEFMSFPPVPTRITTNQLDDTLPAWHPSQDLIVFRTDRAPYAGAPNLGAVEPDGSNERLMASGPNNGAKGLVTTLCWLPANGNVMVEEQRGRYEFLEFDVTQDGFRRTVLDGGDAAFTRKLLIGSGRGWGIRASHDGSTVMWRSKSVTGIQTLRVATYASLNGGAANGHGTALLSETNMTTEFFMSGFSLTPDGSQAVIPMPDGHGTNLFLYNTDGSGTPEKLTTSGLGGYGNRWPCVSPDGTRVAWVMVHTSPTVPTNLGVKRLHGTGIGGTFLADWDANDSRPCWSPDGTHIAFQRFDDENTGGLLPGESPNWNIYVVEAP